VPFCLCDEDRERFLLVAPVVSQSAFSPFGGAAEEKEEADWLMGGLLGFRVAVMVGGAAAWSVGTGCG